MTCIRHYFHYIRTVRLLLNLFHLLLWLFSQDGKIFFFLRYSVFIITKYLLIHVSVKRKSRNQEKKEWVKKKTESKNQRAKKIKLTRWTFVAFNICLFITCFCYNLHKGTNAQRHESISSKMKFIQISSRYQKDSFTEEN